ncbi:hypothetical protein [Pseudodesulfovibrio portus]|uniref:DUF1440 domain-containing protein n=1 Tax=Pseudodesulfovibrio portus TaxID=231439 RepID=A0ABM8AV57_9BACT|nr:hypothetical protein [Pseudodesulfovibrio portus]BDQ35343.1 hypothetical protein JCM14722_28850 [Pseudodesulfovibrio portus]
MHRIFKALLLGLAAGIIDAIPMVFQGLPWEANISALLHWLGLGIIITYARMPLPNWASGSGIALLTGIPIAVLAYPANPTSVFPVIIFSAILGGLLGYTSDRLINRLP